MRNKFGQYYGLEEPEFAQLWQDAFIIFDTNVLLNVYRLPDDVRDEFLNLLDTLKERLWIPHQVAMEYQRRRLNVISQRKKLLSDKRLSISETIATLRQEVETVEIDKYKIESDASDAFSKIDDLRDILDTCLAEILESHVDLSISDPIRDRLDSILGDNVGSAPEDQEQLDKIQTVGKTRYALEKPPGYKDKEKESDEGAIYDHAGLRYETQFGDLILWEQILEWCASAPGKSVIFVTADAKDDWWLRISGKTIGPRPELLEEISTRGQARLFWMYSFPNFGKYAKQYLDAELSDRSLEEISLVTGRRSKLQRLSNADLFAEHELEKANALGYENARRAVSRWVSFQSDNIFTSSFSNFIAEKGNRRTAYQIVLGDPKDISTLYMNLSTAMFKIRESFSKEYADDGEIILIVNNFSEIPIEVLYRILDLRRSLDAANAPTDAVSMTIGSIHGIDFKPIIKIDSDGDISWL